MYLFTRVYLTEKQSLTQPMLIVKNAYQEDKCCMV